MSIKDKIQIFDNFLPAKVFEEIQVHLKQPRWTVNASYPKNEKIFWGMDLTKDEYFNKTVYSYIKKVLDKKYKIKKILANAQSYGQDGSPHIDTDVVDSKTFIIYANKDWDFLWGGETRFFDRYVIDKETTIESDEMLHVLPVPNRAVLFPSCMFHYGMSPTRDFHGLRYTIAYQFIKVEEKRKMRL